MYSIIVILFLIGCLMISVGMLGRAGAKGFDDIDGNVAAAMGLLVTYMFFLLHFSSFSGLTQIFEAVSGGIPFLQNIVDYGTLRNLLHEAPMQAATSFMDTVFLSAIIQLVSNIPMNNEDMRKKLMVRILTSVVVSLVSLMLLNYVIKQTGLYRYAVTAVGAIISLLSLGSIPASIVSLLKKNAVSGVGLLTTVILFSKNPLIRILRTSFFDSIIYVAGIYVLESRFHSIAESVSVISVLIVSFMPVLLMLIGIYYILKSVCK